MLFMRPVLTKSWTATKIFSSNIASNRSLVNAYTIPTTQGKVRGAQRVTMYNDCYYSFEGIPFAKPPLGELRFASPQPNEPWNGVRDCLEPSCKPMQVNEMNGKVEGAEDCLYLNVYVKTFQTANLLPVLVWICGGGFAIGEGSPKLYGPEYFMRKEVVLVCFNYRLGPLGFLSLADPGVEVPGNAGLKDQVLALRWIKQNISSFNGDENNIFVFGNSAGGASTHYMTATEQTRGLFHKAALMSGTIMSSWSNEAHLDNAYRLAKLIGYSGQNCDEDVLKYLRCVEAQELVIHDIVTPQHKLSGKFLLFVPTIEPYESKDCVIPKAPIDMLRFAWGNAIPILLGGTSFEGLVMFNILKQNPILIEILEEHPHLLVPLDVSEKYKDPKSAKYLAKKLMETYCIETCASKEAALNYLRYISDKFFWHGTHRTALSRLQYATAPTYFYRFAFDSPQQSLHRKKYCGKEEVEGVAHADELPYLLNMRESREFACDAKEYQMIELMVELWTSFAKNSDPNNDKLKPLVWRPLRRYEPNMALNIDCDIEMKEIAESKNLKLWNSMYERYQLY